jgi:hypothetical protein
MNPLDEINSINSNSVIVKTEYLRAKDISNNNKSNEEVQKIFADITQKYVKTNAGGEALATVFGVDYQTLMKLEAIEKWFLYHRFYFKGSDDPILRKGNDFSNWDPRYMEDYIIEAIQKGYKNYFLYYDRNERKLRPKSALDLQQDLRNLEGNCNDSRACASSLDAFVGCMFFDKQGCTDYKNIFEYVMNLADYNESLNDLKKKLGLNSISDHGYLALDISSTFGDINDIEYQQANYLKYEAQYKEFCDKMINALSDVPYLQFCVNKSGGVFEGENINISQVMNCTQNISTNPEISEISEGSEGSEGSETKSENIIDYGLFSIHEENKYLPHIVIIICLLILIIEYLTVFYRRNYKFTFVMSQYSQQK